MRIATLRWVAALAILCWLAPLPSPAAAGDESGDEEALRVLFIGNSFTFYNGLPRVVSALAARTAGAPRIESRTVAVGGYTLERHWEDPATRAALYDGPWDAVVLQEQSQRPLRNSAAMLEFARQLHRAHSNGDGRTVLFMTWARRDVPGELDPISRAYREVAAELGAEVAPVGEAWRRSIERRPDLRLHDADGLHPNRAGTYLAACVLVAQLTGAAARPPEPPTLGLDPEVAGALERVAAETALGRAVAAPGG